MVDVFVRSRLVIAGDGGLEVAHEALVREWPRLRTWLDDDVEGQRILRHLAVTAEAWEGLGRPDSELYRGLRLAQAEEWRARGDPDHHPRGAGVPRCQREPGTGRSGRAQRTESAGRPARTGACSVLLAAAAVLLVGVHPGRASSRYVSVNRADSAAHDAEVQASRAGAAADNATQQATRADAAGTLAEARRLGTQALVVDDYDQSLLLAVEARHLKDSLESRGNLLAAIQRSPGAIGVVRSRTEATPSTSPSPPDGKSLRHQRERGKSDDEQVRRHRTRHQEGSVAGTGADPPRARSAPMAWRGDVVLHRHLLGKVARSTLRIVDMATFTATGAPLSGLDDFLGPPDTTTRSALTVDTSPRSRTTISPGGVSSIPVALVWDVAQGGGPVVQYPFAGADPPARTSPSFRTRSGSSWLAATALRSSTSPSGRKVGQIDGTYAPIAISPRRQERSLQAIDPATARHDRPLRPAGRAGSGPPWPVTATGSSAWSSAPTAPRSLPGATTAW